MNVSDTPPLTKLDLLLRVTQLGGWGAVEVLSHASSLAGARDAIEWLEVPPHFVSNYMNFNLGWWWWNVYDVRKKTGADGP